MTWTVRVLKWDEFQHYQKRSPIWVKLYRRNLDKREWRALHGSAAKLLVDLWMLAAEYRDGEITLPLADMAWRLRIEHAEMLTDLQVLVSYSFIELASITLATREQVAMPEERRERGEKEEIPASRGVSENWVRVLASLWRAQYDGEPNFGAIGKHCKALFATHGLDKLRAHWITYLKATSGQYASPARFAQTFGEWAPRKTKSQADAILRPHELRDAS